MVEPVGVREHLLEAPPVDELLVDVVDEQEDALLLAEAHERAEVVEALALGCRGLTPAMTEGTHDAMHEAEGAERQGMALHSRRRVGSAVVDGVLLYAVVDILFPFSLVLGPLYVIVGARWRTLGERVAGIRVVERDALAALSFRRAALRAMPLCMLMAVWSLPLYGETLFQITAALWIAAEVWLYRQGWRLGLGDLIAGTATVRFPPRVVPLPPAAQARVAP